MDCGGGEEGEQAGEEEAGQEEQGGEQHCSLEQHSEALVIRCTGSRCEDVEGECNKGVYHTITTDLTVQCVGTNRDGDDGIDGQGDQGIESEEGCHDSERGSPKYCMGDKEGHPLEDWKQFGRDIDLLIFIQVEGGVQVPFRAELGHRQEAGGETSDLEEPGCRVFRDTVIQKNIEN